MKRLLMLSLLALGLTAPVAAPALAQINLLEGPSMVKAVTSNDASALRLLLLKGENPNQVDASGRPVLLLAIGNGDRKSVV